MHYIEDITEAIGRTPLVKLNRIGAGLRFNLFVKVEALNPGGSAKDRIALRIVQDAEKRGLLKPGGTIVEATAGNTGAGLAMVAARHGYRCIFVLPDKMSADKVNLLKAYGAEVVITKTSVTPDSPENYNNVADRLAREIPGAFRAGQFTNPENPEAHYHTTGPEIYEALEGKVDVFVAGMGTCGTISGVARFLKEKNPRVRIVGADPEGSILSGDTPHAFKVEGIGEDFVPNTLDRKLVDDMVRISDAESFATARRLAREEGILAGGSSGTAVAAALKYAQRMPSGANVVALLPDTGRNYLSKLYSDEWMAQNGFLSYIPENACVGDVLRHKNRYVPVIFVGPKDTARTAMERMRENGFSQLPVIEGGHSYGSVTETALIRLLREGGSLDTTTVTDIQGDPFPLLDESVSLTELQRLLIAGAGGVLAANGNAITGFLSKIDLIHFLYTRK